MDGLGKEGVDKIWWFVAWRLDYLLEAMQSDVKREKCGLWKVSSLSDLCWWNLALFHPNYADTAESEKNPNDIPTGAMKKACLTTT